MMEFTNWQGNCPVKDPRNATRRKCEGKIEGPSSTCPLVIMVLFALRSQTLWQHRWEAVHDLQVLQDLLFPSFFSHTGQEDKCPHTTTYPCY